jgi:hypothetical protein
MRPLLTLLVLAALPAWGQTVRHPFTFSLLPQTLPDVRWGEAAWADVDGDGDLDLFLTGQMRDDPLGALEMRGLLLRNDGATPDPDAPGGDRIAFTTVQTDLPALAHASASWADYDGDGDPDLAVSGSTRADAPYDAQTHLLRNDGGRLTRLDAGLPALHSGTVRWADHDGDGRPDLYLTGTADARAPYAPQGVLLVQRGGAFEPVDAGVPPLVFGDVDWSDATGDGRPDLAVSGLTAGRTLTALYRHDGSRYVRTDALPGRLFGSLARIAGGWAEFAARPSRSGFAPTARLVTSGAQPLPIDALFGGQAESGDLDGDGDLDLALAGVSSPHRGFETIVYRADPGGWVRSANLIGSLGRGLALADADGDRDLDLLVVGYNASGASTSLYRNETGNPRGIPLAPSGLAAASGPDGLTLSWSAAPGARYDVWVGTAPGRPDIRRPAARLDGTRLTTDAGLEGGTLTLRLPEGAYWWGVQTVTAERVGSPFALGEAAVVTSGPAGERPTRLSLGAPAPSPARGAFTALLDLPSAAAVTADLFDATGRRVARLADATLPAGRHPLTWSGAAGSGLYLLRVQAGASVLTRPVHLIAR